MTFSIIKRDGSGNISERIPVLENVTVNHCIKPPNLPELKNKVILRAGLEYDEAFLMVTADADRYLNDGRWSFTGAEGGTPTSVGGIGTLGLPGTFYEIEIGQTTIGGWLLLNRYKIAAGSDGVNGPKVSICHFVCQRYLLEDSPPAHYLSLYDSGGATLAQANISTAKIIDGLSGNKTQELVKLICSQRYWYFGSRTSSGSVPTPQGDVTFTSGLPSTPPHIFTPGRTLAGLLQFYLGNRLLRRRYQPNTDPSVSNSHYSLETISFSGTKYSGPVLCSWQNGQAHFDRVGDVSSFDGTYTWPFNKIIADASSPTANQLGGRYKTTPIHASQRGSLTPSQLGMEFMRDYRNRNSEGVIVPGHSFYAPNGYYNEVIYCDDTTTLIRRPIKFFEDRPHFEEWDICIGIVVSGSDEYEIPAHPPGGFGTICTVRIDPYNSARYVHSTATATSFEIGAANASDFYVFKGDPVIVFKSLSGLHGEYESSRDSPPATPKFYFFPMRREWQAVPGTVQATIAPGDSGNVQFLNRYKGNGISGLVTVSAKNLSTTVTAASGDSCVVVKYGATAEGDIDKYGFLIS